MSRREADNYDAEWNQTNRRGESGREILNQCKRPKTKPWQLWCCCTSTKAEGLRPSVLGMPLAVGTCGLHSCITRLANWALPRWAARCPPGSNNFFAGVYAGQKLPGTGGSRQVVGVGRPRRYNVASPLVARQWRSYFEKLDILIDFYFLYRQQQKWIIAGQY